MFTYLAAQNVNIVLRRSAAFFSGLLPPKLQESTHVMSEASVCMGGTLLRQAGIPVRRHKHSCGFQVQSVLPLSLCLG